MQTRAPGRIAAQVLHVVDSHGDGDDVGTRHHCRPGDEVGHARGVGSAAGQDRPRDGSTATSMQHVGKPARHRVAVLAHSDSRSDGVADHDDPQQVATASDPSGGPGGFGEPFDPASHPPTLEHDHGQEGEHTGPAQLIG